MGSVALAKGGVNGKVVFAALTTAEQGHNPGSYRIYWNESTREYRVALTDLPVGL